MNQIQKNILVFILLFQGIYLFGNHSGDVFQRANEAYKESRFQEASVLYQSIVDSGQYSAEVYYNLGNSYFKLNDVPRAILNYERALLLDPTDTDINFNLDKSRTFVIDKIEAIPEFFVKAWFREAVVVLTSDTWAILALVLFVLVVSGFLLFFFTKRIAFKKLVFTISVVISLGFIIVGFFAVKSKTYIDNSKSAIVLTPTVTVKSSPNKEGMDVFIIHEGSKVVILRNLAGWCEIKIADGKQGWLELKDIEKI